MPDFNEYISNAKWDKTAWYCIDSNNIYTHTHITLVRFVLIFFSFSPFCCNWKCSEQWIKCIFMQLKFIYFAFVQLFKILYDALRIGQGTKTTTTNFDDDNGTPLFRFSFYAHVFFTYFPHSCRYVLSHIHTSTLFFPLIWARAYEIHFRTLFVKTLCVFLLLLFEQKKNFVFYTLINCHWIFDICSFIHPKSNFWILCDFEK